MVTWSGTDGMKLIRFGFVASHFGFVWTRFDCGLSRFDYVWTHCGFDPTRFCCVSSHCGCVWIRFGFFGTRWKNSKLSEMFFLIFI